MERNAAGETIRPSPRNAVILLESEIVKEAEERRRLIRGARRAKHTMTSSLSELELRRLENIERNVQYMKELGISPSGVRRSDGTAKRSRSAPKRSAPSVAKEQEQETQFVRRSSRIAQLKEVDYEEDKISTSNGRRSSHAVAEEHEVEGARRKISADLPSGSFVGAPENLAADATSGMQQANVDIFLQKLLGAPLDDFGKAAVMQLANNGKTPRFNKYSGVAEWSNSLFLWVNIGGVSGYDNAFSDQGRRMMWYGGSKMHSESRVVQRLYAAGMGNSADNLTAQPIAIKWELVDFAGLQDSEFFLSILS